MDRYSYNGPVMMGDKYIGKFSGETMANSIAEAKKNLTYQCKKKCNTLPGSNIKLTGEVTRV